MHSNFWMRNFLVLFPFFDYFFSTIENQNGQPKKLTSLNYRKAKMHRALQLLQYCFQLDLEIHSGTFFISFLRIFLIVMLRSIWSNKSLENVVWLRHHSSRRSSSSSQCTLMLLQQQQQLSSPSSSSKPFPLLFPKMRKLWPCFDTVDTLCFAPCRLPLLLLEIRFPFHYRLHHAGTHAEPQFHFFVCASFSFSFEKFWFCLHPCCCTYWNAAQS